MKKKMPLLVFTFLLIITSILFNGCFSRPQAKPEIKPKTKIGLCLAEKKTDRNKYIEKQFQQIATKEKIRLVITEANKDPLKQKENIEKMIKEGVKAVILQPVDTLIAKDYVSMLQEKNIKVILIDALPPDISVDAYIAPDYIRSGELQAQFLLEQNQDQQILILKGDKQNNITEAVLEGNLNILKNNLLVKKLDIVEVPNWDQKNAYNILTKKLTENEYNGIIAHYEEIGLGVNKFLKEKNLENKITFTTVGINKNLLQTISAEKKLAAIDTLPNLVAQFAIKAASNLVQSDSWEYDLQIKNGLANVPAKLIPIRLITKNNLYLLQERFGEIKGETEKPQTNNKGTDNKKQKQTKLKVKTKDGKEFEVTIPGEIKGVEMLPMEQ